jgi:hybrid cluster-associated redox disulfide protein
LTPSRNPNLQASLDEIMRRWPATIRVFLHHGMLCVGCPIAILHTVSDTCDAHDVERKRFEDELSAAIGDDEISAAQPYSEDERS